MSAIINTERHIVRVYFFRPSGKWYETHRLAWIKDGYLMKDIYEAFALSLRARFIPYSVTLQTLKDLDVICFEPYHKNSHPIQFKKGAWLTYQKSNSEGINLDIIKNAVIPY